MTEEQELKIKFAEEWLRQPDNPFGAALIATNDNQALALKMSDFWVRDPEVLAFRKQLIERHGEDAFLPSQATILHDVFNRAKESFDPDAYVKLIRLAADIRGWIQKPGVTINNNVTTNKVMVIPVRVGSDGKAIDSHQWEQQLIQQQTGLING